MQFILTDINEAIECASLDGSITIHELKVWPGWTFPKFTSLFSFDRGGKSHTVPVVMGKVYALEDLESLVAKHLNVDEQVALLYYNNGRVTWRSYPDVKTTNVTLDATLKHMLGLKDAQADQYGIQIGKPVKKSSINFAFSTATMLFFSCDQIDNTFVNNVSTKTITAIPDSLNGSFTANLNTPITSPFHNNYLKKLNFKCCDQHGSTLPVKQFFARIAINKNDRECLSIKDLPRNTIRAARR